MAENYELANEFNISRIPQVFLFNGGKKPVRQMAGLVPENELVKVLNELLKK